MLQQYLPLAVLKPANAAFSIGDIGLVATVLTACGIETILVTGIWYFSFIELQQYLPLAVLKHALGLSVRKDRRSCNSTYRLRY